MKMRKKIAMRWRRQVLRRGAVILEERPVFTKRELFEEGLQKRDNAYKVRAKYKHNTYDVADDDSKTPVYTINLGYQFSMGFLLGLCGHKRFATKNAKFLWHDGTSGALNSSAKVRDEIEFQSRNEDRVRQYVLEHTKIDPELYDSKLRVEWYMFADEAKELGVVDYIVGVDCDIDEII